MRFSLHYVYDVYNIYQEEDVMTLRKNITIKEEDYSLISDYCKKIGKSFSEFLRDVAMEVIQKSEEMDLYDYLIQNVSFVSKKEQEEFEELDLDLENKGRELKVDDIL